MFCSNCGSEVKEGQAICLNCGFAIDNSSNTAVSLDSYFSVTNVNGASRVVSLVLAWLLGCVGAHRLYMKARHRWTMLILGILGVFLVFPLLITGVWGFIDAIRILVASNDDYEVLFVDLDK